MESTDLLATTRTVPKSVLFQNHEGLAEFVNREPEVFERWIYDGAREAAELKSPS